MDPATTPTPNGLATSHGHPNVPSSIQSFYHPSANLTHSNAEQAIYLNGTAHQNGRSSDLITYEPPLDVSTNPVIHPSSHPAKALLQSHQLKNGPSSLLTPNSIIPGQELFTARAHTLQTLQSLSSCLPSALISGANGLNLDPSMLGGKNHPAGLTISNGVECPETRFASPPPTSNYDIDTDTTGYHINGLDIGHAGNHNELKVTNLDELITTHKTEQHSNINSYIPHSNFDSCAPEVNNIINGSTTCNDNGTHDLANTYNVGLNDLSIGIASNATNHQHVHAPTVLVSENFEHRMAPKATPDEVAQDDEEEEELRSSELSEPDEEGEDTCSSPPTSNLSTISSNTTYNQEEPSRTSSTGPTGLDCRSTNNADSTNNIHHNRRNLATQLTALREETTEEECDEKGAKPEQVTTTLQPVDKHALNLPETTVNPMDNDSQGIQSAFPSQPPFEEEFPSLAATHRPSRDAHPFTSASSIGGGRLFNNPIFANSGLPTPTETSRVSTDKKPYRAPTSSMAVKSSQITQIVNISYPERRFKPSVTQPHLGEQQMSEQNWVCSDIMNKTGAHLELQQNNGDNSLTVMITGKAKLVEEAKKLVIQQLQTQSHATIEIPKEYHPSILGRGGDRVRQIESECGVRVHIPSRNILSNTIRVEGAKESVAQAIAIMQSIFQERAKHYAQRVTVETLYLPFIRGPDSSWFKRTEEQTGVRIRVIPTTSPHQDHNAAAAPATVDGNSQGDGPAINPNTSAAAAAKTMDILVTGLRDQVEAVINVITNIYHEKKQTCSKFEYRIDRKKHKYISGRPRNSYTQQIFAETGVLVLLPTPNDADPDLVTLFGPKKFHGAALTMVLEKADSVIEETIEVSKWIHKHIFKSEALKLIYEQCPNIHIEAKKEAGAEQIDLEGPPEQVQKAVFHIRTLVRGIKERIRIQEIPVEACLHSFIIGKNGSTVNRIQEISGVDGIKVPGDKGLNFVQIEGSPDAISIAIREILDIVDRRENELSVEIDIDPRHIPLLKGTNGERIRELKQRFGDEIIISLPFTSNNNTAPNQKQKLDPGPNKIRIRGIKQTVQACAAYIEDLKKSFAQLVFGEAPYPAHYFECHVISQQRFKRHLRQTFTDLDFKFPYPTDLAPSTVPNHGAFSNNSLEALTAAASNNSSTATMTKQQRNKNKKASNQDPPSGTTNSNAQSALHQQHQSSNQSSSNASTGGPTFTFHSIYPPPVLTKKVSSSHSSLVSNVDSYANNPTDESNKGIKITSAKEFLKACPDGLAEIRLPRTDGTPLTLGYREKADINRHCETNFETTLKFPGAKFESNIDPNQQDIVTVIGKRNALEKTKNYLKKIFNEINDRQTIYVEIETQNIPYILGAKGARLTAICEETGCKIRIPQTTKEGRARKYNANNSPRRKDQNLSVKNSDENGLEEAQEDESRDVNENVSNQASSTKQPTLKCKIEITGRPEMCEQAKQAILDNIATTETMFVDKPLWRELNNAAKSGEQPIRAKFRGVLFRILNARESTGGDGDQLEISLSGSIGQVRKARTYIQELDRPTNKKEGSGNDNSTITVNVPDRFKGRLIGRGGSGINALSVKHGVKILIPSLRSSKGVPTAIVNTNGDAVVPSPNESSNSRRSSTTQDVETSSSVSTEEAAENQIDMTISTIRIVGSPDSVERAKADIEEKIAQMEKGDSVRVEVPTTLMPRFIGAQGRTVRQLMTEFDIVIDTRNRAGNSSSYNSSTKGSQNAPAPGMSVLTLTGRLENCLRAKEHILKLKEKYMESTSNTGGPSGRGYQRAGGNANRYMGSNGASSMQQQPPSSNYDSTRSNNTYESYISKDRQLNSNNNNQTSKITDFNSYLLTPSAPNTGSNKNAYQSSA